MDIDAKNREKNTRKFSILTFIALLLALAAIIIVALTNKTIRSLFRYEESEHIKPVKEQPVSSKKNDAQILPTEFSILEIGKGSNEVLFKGYIVDQGGNIEKPNTASWEIELVWGNDPGAKIIPYGGFLHGYRLYPLERKVERRFNEGLNDWVETDIWFLTLQKKGQEPIAIRQNTAVAIEAFYTRLLVSEGRDKGAILGKFYDGDIFTLHDEEFIVNAVRENEVVLVDNKQRFITLYKSK